MPSNNKIAIHNMPYFITTRCQENIPFTACVLVNFLLWSILARARQKYDLRISAAMFMGNHMHMLVVTDDPAQLASFVGYVKRETAHAINDLLGREKHTVWCEGFEASIVLSPEDVIKILVYIYTNPVAAGLVASVDEYPGVSTWRMFKNNQIEKKMRGFSRYTVTPLESLNPSNPEQDQYIESLICDSKFVNTFIFEPWAWMQCFKITKSKKPQALKKLILDEVTAREKQLKEERQEFIGAEALKQMPINAPHQPKKFSRKNVVICSDKSLRRFFLTWFFEQQKIARAARLLAALTGSHEELPAGFFTSGGNLLTNLICMPTQFVT